MKIGESLMICLSFISTFFMSGCPDHNGDNYYNPMGGDYDECAETTSEAVTWDAVGALGISPAEAFSGLQEPCTSTLVWDASNFDRSTINPMAGESEVTVTVSLDPSTARLTRATDSSCDDVYLEVGGTAHIVTADCTFDDTGAVTIEYSNEWGLSDFSFVVDTNAMGGTFSMVLSDNETGEIRYSFDGTMAHCAGDMEMWTEGPGESGTSDGGSIGGWTNTGCPLGAEPVDVSAIAADGSSIQEQLVATWSENTFAGIWDDGQQTALDMQVEILDAKGCVALPGEALLPVDVRYLTEDGRLGDRTVAAKLGVAFNIDGNFSASTVSIYEERVCGNESDDIGYTMNSCAELESILIQLHISRQASIGNRISDTRATIYEYNNESSASPGTADRVRELAISL